MYAVIHSGGGGSSDFNPTLFQNSILIPNKECKLMTQFFPREKAVSGTLFCADLHVFDTRELGLNPIFHDQIFWCFTGWKNLLSDLEGQQEQIQICSLQAGFTEWGWTPRRLFYMLCRLYCIPEESHACISHVLRRVLLPSTVSVG